MLPIGLKSGLAVFFAKLSFFQLNGIFLSSGKQNFVKIILSSLFIRKFMFISTLSTTFSTEKLWKGEITVSIFVEKVEKR